MRNFLIFIGSVGLFISACNQSTTQVGSGTTSANGGTGQNLVPQVDITQKDSASILETDDYVRYINTIDKSLDREDFRPNVVSEKDQMTIFRQDGKIVYAVAALMPGESRERDYYYLKDDQIVFYRHLEWHPEIGLSYAKETIVFLRDGKVYELQERQADLDPGLGPNVLFAVKFKRPPVDKEYVRKDIEERWVKFKETIQVN